MTESPLLSEFLREYPLYFYLFVGALGLIVGSFLNVVILRLPEMMQREWRSDCHALLDLEDSGAVADEKLSLSFPGSHCPHCQHAIKPWENIPVISFLALRGRCSSCATAISWRYPAVELATAVASLTVAFHIGVELSLIAYLLLTWTLIALAVIDIDTQLLPDDLTLPLLWAGLLFNVFLGPVSPVDAILGAAGGYLLLWSIYWLFKLATGKEGMGYGDFKLLAALGAWLGWQSLPIIILLSSAVGAVLGILIIAAQGKDRSQPLPFGPYLATAGWISLLWGSALSTLFLDGGP
ncbi:prepilin peptidase [Congregibacter litoralis]|uniref:Prepilin leader peptidase/N-methyltransferase n=1 Tax=Congregibacter litoralis KT71 TaxID=314285 RepID=A4A5H1_9GAMM|nr:A24 family peptidase [Congregibacter litoralis]EAQ99042.1 putative aspartic peptidase [Congregibacter litoralis KT71]